MAQSQHRGRSHRPRPKRKKRQSITKWLWRSSMRRGLKILRFWTTKLWFGLKKYRKPLAIAFVAYIALAGVTPLFLGKSGVKNREWLAITLYREAAYEGVWGRWAVAAATFNRRDETKYFAHAKTTYQVVTDRKHGCQYSYFCDGLTDVPKPSWRWGRIKVEAWFLQGLDRWWLPDITFGALFYWNPATATDDWFPEQIEIGRFRRVPMWYGQHRFYWVVDR